MDVTKRLDIEGRSKRKKALLVKATARSGRNADEA